MRKLAVQELNRVSTKAYKDMPKRPITVILDNIRSANNVGSIFRTCDAFAVERIIITGYSARPPHKDILKTALGATESVEWEYNEDIAETVSGLKSDGYEICVVEQAEGAISLKEMQWDPDRKYVIVFGNEVKGVSESVMQLADKAIEVPQWGTKHSLNVSVCAGVVLWDVVTALS